MSDDKKLRTKEVLFWCAVVQGWRVNECMHYHHGDPLAPSGCGWPRYEVVEE